MKCSLMAWLCLALAAHLSSAVLLPERAPPADCDVPSTAVSALRRSLSGTVLLPQDSAFAPAATQNNHRFTARPCLVAACADTRDVARAVQWAAAQALPISVKSGGHSYEGWAVRDGTLLLDLSGMNSTAVHFASMTARLGPGARSGDVVDALQARGVAGVTGGCPTVAMGGFLLGGGLGITARSMGVGLDQVLAMEVVLPNGTVTEVDAHRHKDLYWALRGGCGANFGIVTEFHVKVYRLPATVLGGHIAWPLEMAGAVGAAFQRHMATADRRLGLMFLIMPKQVLVNGVFAGPPAAGWAELLPFLKIEGGQNGFIEGTYAECYHRFAGGDDPKWAHRMEDMKSGFITEPYPEAVLAEMARRIGANPAFEGSFFINALGGQVDAVSRTATAFWHRGMRANSALNAIWYDAALDADMLAWANRTHQELMASHLSGEVYCNYPNHALPAWPQAYYGGNYKRLVAVKHLVDPQGVLWYPQGIGADQP